MGTLLAEERVDTERLRFLKNTNLVKAEAHEATNMRMSIANNFFTVFESENSERVAND